YTKMATISRAKRSAGCAGWAVQPMQIVMFIGAGTHHDAVPGLLARVCPNTPRYAHQDAPDSYAVYHVLLERHESAGYDQQDGHQCHSRTKGAALSGLPADQQAHSNRDRLHSLPNTSVPVAHRRLETRRSATRSSKIAADILIQVASRRSHS